MREYRVSDGERQVFLDFAWPDAKVALEADSRRWHSTSDSFARDRRKHNVLVEQGWVFLRVTWADVSERPGWVERSIRGLLDAC